MTVTSVQKDPEALTMTITSEYTADVKRVWQLWENPRQLERWWGPPTYPATFVDHDLEPGGGPLEPLKAIEASERQLAAVVAEDDDADEDAGLPLVQL